jgi:hypothetical protein
MMDISERLMNREQGRNTSYAWQKFETDNLNRGRTKIELAGPGHSTP